MRHSVYGRKLSRTTDERKRLFAGMVRDLLIHGAITTTIAKAKAVQPIVEKLITRAKMGGEVNRRHVISTLSNRTLADQLIEETKTRFFGRTSGYTRIVKVGKRLGDATNTAQLSFVDTRVVAEVVTPKKETKKTSTKEEVKLARVLKEKKVTVKKTAKKVAKK